MPEKHNKVHFIAIGGSVMHHLAIALKNEGHEVSGSDDGISDPSRSVLSAHGILPKEMGWFPEKITPSLDAVIIGMHAQKDNPELLKAMELNIPVYSFPDFIYQRSIDKHRIVIAGSHGKTTITALIIHVLNYFNRNFDYVIGARVKGLENSVRLSSDAPLIIIEGDEYFSSPLDPTPKFIRYNHHIGVISGIAWDHANVFPTEDIYVQQFDRFADQSPKGGILIFAESDPMVSIICKKGRADVQSIPYRSQDHVIEQGKTFLRHGKDKIPVSLIGDHNMQNISAARETLRKIGISNDQFFEAIPSFQGAQGRMELVKETDSFSAYKDFAHAPSKVKATVKALKKLHPKREITACLELHTYSSLNKSFLPQYHDSLKEASTRIIYINPEKEKAKNAEPLTDDFIRNAFSAKDLLIFRNQGELSQFLSDQKWNNKNLLMMSSGNFGGMDFTTLMDAI